MANTVHDPVCGMDIDPATGQALLSIKGKLTTSALQDARSPLTRSLRSM